MHNCLSTTGIVFFATVLMASDVAQAQTKSDISFWQNALRQNSLPELAHLMTDKKKPAWPAIEFYNDKENSKIEQAKIKQQLVDLAKNLFLQIQTFEKKSRILNDADLVVTTKIYSDVSGVLRKQGGYINYVLADSANRLALGHLCSFLVQSPSKYGVVIEALSYIRVPTFDKEEFGKLLEKEAGLVGASDKLRNIVTSGASNEIVSLLGGNVRDFGMGLDPEQLKTSFLLEHFKLIYLLRRMADTDAVGVIYLPGLAEFLKKGGAFKDIHADDISDFQRVMGEDVNRFKCEWLNIRMLSTLHLTTIIEEFGSSDQTSSFAKIAME